MYTPEERQAVLDRLLAELAKDARIAGVLIVGSGAVGFKDALSDLDIVVVVTDEDGVKTTWSEWRERIAGLFPTVGYFESIRGPNIFLHGFLLANFLEIDISFQHFNDLVARRAHWRVAFDRSDRIETILRTSWDNRRPPDPQETYLKYLSSIWYYVSVVTKCVQRGQVWRAIYELETIRTRAVELAGLRLGVEAQDYHDADRLPPEVLTTFEAALVRTVEPGEVRRALRAAVACFFREARALDAQFGLDAVGDLERQMVAYMDTCL